MRMKKRFFVCAILAILISLMCQMTFAYFTTTVTAENVITAGGIQIELYQKNASGEDIKDPNGIMPGHDLNWITTVKNLQDDAYVRVKVEAKIVREDGAEAVAEGDALSEILAIDFNTTDWTEQDGIWYYNTPVTANEVTKPLFEKVSFNTNMPNEYQGVSISLNVQAQATQVANNGTGVLTAAGWPEF